MATRSSADVLRSVEEKLEIAQPGANDVSVLAPSRRLAGLVTVVNMGVVMTQALRGLRNTAPEVETWYREKVAEMRADPLLRFF
jgi:hypothetical protein